MALIMFKMLSQNYKNASQKSITVIPVPRLSENDM